MKNRYTQAANLIQQALNLIGENPSMDDVRASLRRSISALGQKAKRQAQKNVWAEKFLEEGKQKNKQFWEMIVKNAKELAAKQSLEDIEKNIKGQQMDE